MGKEFLGHAARALNNREAQAVERSIFGDQPVVQKQADAFGRRPVLHTAVDVSAIDAYFDAFFAHDAADDVAEHPASDLSQGCRDEVSTAPEKDGGVEAGREPSDDGRQREAGSGRIV